MNSYPSAAKGVKKIFSAEVLQLIGTLCMSLGTVFFGNYRSCCNRLCIYIN